MSTNIIRSASEYEDDWEIAEKGVKPPSCIVQLRRQTFVLPWFRFLASSGDDNQIEILFASHVINVTGHGLTELLGAIASQHVVRLIQPTESEARFNVRGNNSAPVTGPCITGISVKVAA
jgi:hypothetical protein